SAPSDSRRRRKAVRATSLPFLRATRGHTEKSRESNATGTSPSTLRLTRKLPRNSLLSLRRVQQRFYAVFARPATTSPAPRFWVRRASAGTRGAAAPGAADARGG